MKQVKVEVKVAHAGPHGSYMVGDITLMDKDTAKHLEKVGYVQIVKENSDNKRTATNKTDKEVR